MQSNDRAASASGEPRGERPPKDAPVWVFGYGSLMWRPGFPFADAHDAVLPGYSRSFCIYSFHHRGTRGAPGLVLGLDAGGDCLGRIFRVRAEDGEEVTAVENVLLTVVTDADGIVEDVR